MGSPRNAGYPGKPNRLLVLTSLLLLASFPAGCNSPNKTKQDPLFGVNPPGAAPAPTPPASAVRTKNETSAAPSSLGPNLAWLSTLPDSRPLLIGQPEATASARPAGTTALASTPKNPQQGPGLSAPVVQPVPRVGEDPVVPASTWDKAQPAVSPQSTPGASTVPTAAGGVNVPQPPPNASKPAAAPPQQPPVTEDPLLTAIRAHGITWQDARNVAGGVSFRAIVPDRQNPGRMRQYEAIGPDYPSAVRAVLYKIDHEQK